MAIAMDVQKDIKRVLTLLRNKIRERGFTQIQVQAELKWGRSYISQLLTRQKGVRVDQILQILDVIGIDPADFYAELYHLGTVEAGVTNYDDYADRSIVRGQGGRACIPVEADRSLDDYQEMRRVMRALIDALVKKDVVSEDELNRLTRGLDDDSRDEHDGDPN